MAHPIWLFFYSQYRGCPILCGFCEGWGSVRSAAERKQICECGGRPPIFENVGFQENRTQLSQFSLTCN